MILARFVWGPLDQALIHLELEEPEPKLVYKAYIDIPCVYWLAGQNDEEFFDYLFELELF